MFGQEVSYALFGAWRLARLDPTGLAFFDRSPGGVVRSFRAAIFVYPLFLLLLIIRVDDEAWRVSDPFRIIGVETIGYVVSWAAYPLATLQLARFLDREARWPVFVVAYNWSQVLQTAFFLLCVAISAGGILPSALGHALVLIGWVAVLLYEWYVARVALDVGGAAATAAVLIDLVIGVVVSRVSNALY